MKLLFSFKIILMLYLQAIVENPLTMEILRVKPCQFPSNLNLLTDLTDMHISITKDTLDNSHLKGTEKTSSYIFLKTS